MWSSLLNNTKCIHPYKRDSQLYLNSSSEVFLFFASFQVPKSCEALRRLTSNRKVRPFRNGYPNPKHHTPIDGKNVNHINYPNVWRQSPLISINYYWEPFRYCQISIPIVCWFSSLLFDGYPPLRAIKLILLFDGSPMLNPSLLSSCQQSAFLTQEAIHLCIVAHLWRHRTLNRSNRLQKFMVCHVPNCNLGVST